MTAPDRACPDYPNDCVRPWAHARTYAEVQATQLEARPMPADARQAAWRAYHAAEPPARGRITTAFETAYAAGVAAGRTAAAADIRDAPYPDPSPCLPAWHAGYTEATETAVKIAGGTDR